MEIDPQKRQKRFDAVARSLAMIAIFVMLFSLGAGYYMSILPTPVPVPTETPIPSPTASPTPTRTPPPTARQTPGIREVFIPGLDPEAVRTKFQANMFVCTEAELGEAGFYEWSCEQESSSIKTELRIFSRTADTVDKMTGIVSQPGNPFLGSALRFFRLMAEVQYEGAEPRSAEDWLTITLPKIASDEEFKRAVFGEVLFVLSGTPRQWTFEMGELPQTEGEE
jgi:hypothetical protein